MRLVITSGGTAGHIYPALAVAHELQRTGHEVAFAGTPAGLEARIVSQEDIPYHPFTAAGFDRARPWTLVTSTARIAASTLRARAWLKALRPNAVAGFGGYVSIPVGLAASQLGIPLLIHEQNSAPGMANRFLAKRANAVALTYGQAASHLAPRVPPVVTGNPVRSTLLDVDKLAARASFDIPQDALVLLVFGGSQGARHLNEALASLAPQLLTRPTLHILHLTGPRDYNMVVDTLGAAQVGGAGEGLDASSAAKRGLSEQTHPSLAPPTCWHPIAYCDRMGDAYAAADAVVARAGATSLAEIAALGLPALLVPYPYATDDHQTTNAKALVDAGAALMVPDAQLDTPLFSQALDQLLDNPGLRAHMAQTVRSFGAVDATQAITNMLLQIAK
jgi:UDP-N-acetylglucosamine--N-acetylmuramyl-(pentapeptide) pyrophosphoryl-undecaprenol N-acetylglucosamine transferase